MNAIEPKHLRNRRRAGRGLEALVCCGVLAVAAPAAHAANWLDALFGGGRAQTEAAQAGPGQRVWRLHEFSTIALVGREPGAAENRQPVQVPADVLRQQLAQVRTAARDGTEQALFDPGELAELAPPLAQALERAQPGDDVLLLSAARRGGGILASPRAVTARLFVQGEQLQMIVHDARFEFYDAYRGTHTEPRFTFGSRGAPASGVSISSAGAASVRADWLAMPLRAAAATAGSVQTAPGPLPVSVATPTPALQTPAPRGALDAAAAEDIERRLETLKRLRDKNLITEDQYQQKLKEILQLL
jgi:hypothetical protein